VLEKRAGIGSGAPKTFSNYLFRLLDAKDDTRRVAGEILMGVDAIGRGSPPLPLAFAFEEPVTVLRSG
jgi:hypothetical protein